MNENSNIVRLRQQGEIDDPLTNILWSGARRLLAQAVEMEAEAFLAAMKDLKLPDGRDRVVRHGHGPTREIQTGIGLVEVSRVKIRDRGAASEGERIRFTSAILPRWARRTKSLDALLPVAECMLVLIGATPEGKKELVGFQVGVRESAQSWRELLVEVKRRGLKIAPEIAVGDGALGFWKALDEIFPGAKHQRCWVHKMSSIRACR